MSLIVKKEKPEYTLAPEGLWEAVCCDVIDRGLQDTPWGKKAKVDIRWQLSEKDEKGRRFQVSKRFTQSLHEKADLSKTLEAWRGRKFTPEEREGFDLEVLIGVSCQVQIIHNIKDEGEAYANIQAVVPFPRSAMRLRVEDYVREIEREERKQMEAHPNGPYKADDSDVPF